MNSGLGNLVQYSDSDDEDEQSNEQTHVVGDDVTTNAVKSNIKRKHDVQQDEDLPEINGKKKRSLPLLLPTEISSMFEDPIEGNSSCGTDHDGRQRSFAHIDGDWPSYVYIPVKCSTNFNNLLEAIMKKAKDTLPDLKMNDPKQLHITLSRTVSLRHYWIDTIVQKMKESLCNTRSFKCHLDLAELYTNDEKTRSFLGLRVIIGEDKLKQLTQKIDVILAEFGLAKYYEDPSFHVSLAWRLSDVTETIPVGFLEEVQEILDSFEGAESEEINDNRDCRILNVDCINFKTGNKTFALMNRP